MIRALAFVACLFAFPVGAQTVGPAGPLVPRVQFSTNTILTGSGNYTAPSSALYVCLSGGGGGGGGSGTGTANATAAGGSSGQGKCAFLFTTVGTSISYSVGAAGSGGVGASSAGSAGGDSTFGTLTAKGGTGGPGVGATGSGTATTLAVLYLSMTPGNAPASSLLVTSQSIIAGTNGGASTGGIGAPSPLGWCPLTASVSTGSNGNTATGNGCGGGGAMSTNGTGPFNGGAGSPGAISVSY